MIHATLDDVGTCGKDGMSAVVGYVAYKPQWDAFNWAWKKTLADFGLEYLHTSEYLYKYLRVGGHAPTDEELFRTLDPWIDIVHTYLIKPGTGFGVCVAVRCDAYDQLTPEEKKYVREPWASSFELALGLACWVVKHDLSKENGMAVQMDESQNAAHLYERYQAMKAENETMKKYLGAICFTDDKKHWPVQAADMLGNLTLRAWRNFGSNKRWPEAFQRLVFPDGKRVVSARTFGLEGLRKLASMRIDLRDRMAVPDPDELPSE